MCSAAGEKNGLVWVSTQREKTLQNSLSSWSFLKWSFFPPLFSFWVVFFWDFFLIHGDHDTAWLLWPLWLLSEHATNMIANSYLWLRGETAAFVILPPCQICGWFSIRCLQCRWLNYARESAAVVVYALLHWWRNHRLPHIRPERSSFTWCIRSVGMFQTSVAEENISVFLHGW